MQWLSMSIRLTHQMHSLAWCNQMCQQNKLVESSANHAVQLKSCFSMEPGNQQQSRMSSWYFCYQGWRRTLFGQETVETLRLLHVGPLKVISVICEHIKNDICWGYPDFLTGIGLLKDSELRFHLDKSVKPVAQPVRRILFGMRENVDEKLDELL